MKYRKKPVIIDAILWNGTKESLQEIYRLGDIDVIKYIATNNSLYIQSIEGLMSAKIGDWIVKGVKGELYPVAADIFPLTYEKAE